MSATSTSSASAYTFSTTSPIIASHPNADADTVFKGYAAFAARTDITPFSYHPHKLETDWVELEITHCGICGSDVHNIDSGFYKTDYPQIVGHEVIGIVASIGPDVKHLKVGDRVGVGAQCGACLNRHADCPECAKGHENHCRSKERLGMHGSRFPDGQKTHGGFADRIRLSSHFAFKIPDAIASAEAAPLLCSGITVFAPLQRYMTKKNMKVGIIGIGGLGHMAVLFAAKMALALDAEVTAISHNSKKKDDALKMGAHRFLDTSDADALKAAYRSFDFILATADGSSMDWSSWLSMIDYDGVFCTVGIPEKPIELSVMSLLMGQKSITASNIGSIKEMREMLDYAAKHEVRPIIEKMPMEKVNEGIKKVRDGSVRYRVVLENPTKQA